MNAVDGRRLLAACRDRATLAARTLDPTVADPPDPDHSYRVVGSIPGNHGGRLKTLRNESGLSTWMNRAEGQFAGDGFAGDPFWNDEVIGEALAAWLGLVRLSPTTRLQPDAVEANAALDALNARVPAELHTVVRFYEPAGDAHVPDEDYMVRFVRDLQLPIAACTFEASHDVNFHYLSVLLPPEAVWQKQREGLALLALRDQVRAEGREGEVGPGGRTRGQALDTLVTNWAETVDRFTGAPVVGLAPSVPTNISRADREPDAFLYWACTFCPPGTTPRSNLHEVLTGTPEGLDWWAAWLERFDAAPPLDGYTQALDWTEAQIKDATLRRLSGLRAVVEGWLG